MLNTTRYQGRSSNKEEGFKYTLPFRAGRWMHHTYTQASTHPYPQMHVHTHIHTSTRNYTHLKIVKSALNMSQLVLQMTILCL